jgi:hypothetical protein
MKCLHKHLGLFTVVLLSSILMGAPGEAQQESTENPAYEKLMQTLESLKPAESIEVRMGTEKEEYSLGDDFEIRFQVSQESYITLMDISPEGDITFIMPSIKVQDNHVEADQVYSTLEHFELPMKIAPPTGYETVNLFCTTEEFAFFDSNFEQEPFYTIKKDDEERLNALIDRLEKLSGITWSGTSVQFFIRSSTRSAAPPTSRKFGAIPPIDSTGTTGRSDDPTSP